VNAAATAAPSSATTSNGKRSAASSAAKKAATSTPGGIAGVLAKTGISASVLVLIVVALAGAVALIWYARKIGVMHAQSKEHGELKHA
jgi:LPXTG-motif cell wall-anchored protein